MREHKHKDPKTILISERFERRLAEESSLSDKIADFLTSSFGTVTFLLFNTIIFALWLIANSGILPFVPFDPYPFGLLTTVLSLEAIFLGIIVLISQNRGGRVADLRQQMDFEIDVRTEGEIGKMLDMLDQMRHHMGIKKPDAELETMKQPPNLDALRREIEHEKE